MRSTLALRSAAASTVGSGWWQEAGVEHASQCLRERPGKDGSVTISFGILGLGFEGGGSAPFKNKRKSEFGRNSTHPILRTKKRSFHEIAGGNDQAETTRRAKRRTLGPTGGEGAPCRVSNRWRSLGILGLGFEGGRRPSVSYIIKKTGGSALPGFRVAATSIPCGPIVTSPIRAIALYVPPESI